MSAKHFRKDKKISNNLEWGKVQKIRNCLGVFQNYEFTNAFKDFLNFQQSINTLELFFPDITQNQDELGFSIKKRVFSQVEIHQKIISPIFVLCLYIVWSMCSFSLTDMYKNNCSIVTDNFFFILIDFYSSIRPCKRINTLKTLCSYVIS